MIGIVRRCLGAIRVVPVSSVQISKFVAAVNFDCLIWNAGLL